MKKISILLEGKKTYISLAILLIGFLGLSNYITSEETATILNAIFELIGTVGVIYGRIKAKPKKKEEGLLVENEKIS